MGVMACRIILLVAHKAAATQQHQSEDEKYWNLSHTRRRADSTNARIAGSAPGTTVNLGSEANALIFLITYSAPLSEKKKPSTQHMPLYQVWQEEQSMRAARKAVALRREY